MFLAFRIRLILFLLISITLPNVLFAKPGIQWDTGYKPYLLRVTFPWVRAGQSVFDGWKRKRVTLPIEMRPAEPLFVPNIISARYYGPLDQAANWWQGADTHFTPVTLVGKPHYIATIPASFSRRSQQFATSLPNWIVDAVRGDGPPGTRIKQRRIDAIYTWDNWPKITEAVVSPRTLSRWFLTRLNGLATRFARIAR